MGQLGAVCLRLRQVFGSTFTSEAVRNLLSARELDFRDRMEVLRECEQKLEEIDSYSEDASMLSMNNETFLESFNNPRSRRSTLIFSLS